MPVSLPETVGSFGNQSLVVLTTKPANLAAVPLAAITAGKNITCHMYGDWLPTATTEKVARQRKMCQTKVTQSLGTTTHEVPALQYSYNPQAVGTVGGLGNEAYDVLPEGATVYLVQRLGKSGTADLVATDKYRLFPVELGAPVPGVSSDDAGGEFVINQEIAFADGYDGPVAGVVAA